MALLFVSSPGHKVFRVSYCDSAVYVMRRLLCIICRVSSTFWLLYAQEATLSVRLSWNWVRMFVGSKTRSLDQILEKSFYTLEVTFSVQLSWNLVRMFGMMKSWKWVMLGQKLGHQVKSYKNLVYSQEATFSVWLSWNLVGMFVFIKSRTSWKMGHVGSKTRSLGQILEKPCVSSRGHIFSPVILNLVRMFVLMKSRMSLKMGHVG